MAQTTSKGVPPHGLTVWGPISMPAAERRLVLDSSARAHSSPSSGVDAEDGVGAHRGGVGACSRRRPSGRKKVTEPSSWRMTVNPPSCTARWCRRQSRTRWSIAPTRVFVQPVDPLRFTAPLMIGDALSNGNGHRGRPVSDHGGARRGVLQDVDPARVEPEGRHAR